MAENTAISWAHDTFNPWEGCTRLSPACDNCYAADRAHRFGNDHLWAGQLRRTSPANWRKPLAWNREAALTGKPRRVFCASLADVFDNQAPQAWRDDLWALIAATPHLTWLLLTKRPQNIARMVPNDWLAVPRHNVWFGTTVEDQTRANQRIPHLLATPATMRFLSCEPLLGPVDLELIDEARADECFTGPETRGRLNCLSGHYYVDVLGDDGVSWESCHGGPDRGRGPGGYYRGIDVVIAGGESGPNARPSNLECFRSLLAQCMANGAVFHFKQWGEWFPYGAIDADGHQNSRTKGERVGQWFEWPDGDGFSVRIGKKQAGRLLDGVLHDHMPGEPLA